MKFNQLLCVILVILISSSFSLNADRNRNRKNRFRDGNDEKDKPNFLTSQDTLNQKPKLGENDKVLPQISENKDKEVPTQNTQKKEINESEIKLFDEINNLQVELIKVLTLVYKQLDATNCMIDKLSGYEQHFLDDSKIKKEEKEKESVTNFRSKTTYLQTIAQFNSFVNEFKTTKLVEFVNLLKTAPLINNDNTSLKKIQADGTQAVLQTYNALKNSFNTVAKRIKEMSKNKIEITNDCISSN